MDDINQVVNRIKRSPKGQVTFEGDWHHHPDRIKDILDRASQVPDTYVYLKHYDSLRRNDNGDLSPSEENSSQVHKVNSERKSYGLLSEYLSSDDDDHDSVESQECTRSKINTNKINRFSIEFQARLASIPSENRRRSRAEFTKWLKNVKEMKWSLYERSKKAVQLQRKDRLQREMLESDRAQQLEKLRNEEIKTRQLHQLHQQEEHVKMLESIASKGKELNEYIGKKKREILQHMERTVSQIDAIKKEICSLLATNEKDEIFFYLSKSEEEIINTIDGLYLTAKQAFSQATGSVDEVNVATIESCLAEFKALYRNIEKARRCAMEAKIEKANKAQSVERKVNIEKESHKIENSTSFAVSEKQETTKVNDVTDNSTSLPKNIFVPKHISKMAYREYSIIKEYHEDFKKKYENFMNDPKTKKYRFNLHVAVTTPINAIATQSASHLLDKIERLHNILSGKQVTSKGRIISTAEHPEAPYFCRDVMAQKFVKQADQQISSSHASAFPIALTILGVWCQYPEMGDVLLAHFYSLCPFAVPFNIPKLEGQSEAEYLKSIGYNIKEDDIEDEDQYLKRMSGIIRLYAAIIQSTPPQGPKHPHPHGIKYGWRWLVRVVNMDPVPNITATLLFDFLQVAGHKLNVTYGKQFEKLLVLLCKEYYPKLKEVTPKSKQGPLSRLLIFLQDCIKNRKMPKPEGHLDESFWRKH